jgi:catechol 2,3-dioxygenase-like lactoylglutathione lyase family enzyme
VVERPVEGRREMEVKGLSWLGVRTAHNQEMIDFFRSVLGLRLESKESGFVVFRLPNRDVIEVIALDDSAHTFFTTAPVVGFLVDDVEAAMKEMEAAGVEFFDDEVQRADDGNAWAHFRAPDGNVYEITSGPKY